MTGGYWAVHCRRAGKAHEAENGNVYVLGPLPRATLAVERAEAAFRHDEQLAPSVALATRIVMRDESEVVAARLMARLMAEAGGEPPG